MLYGRLCGAMDPGKCARALGIVAIAGYLGKKDRFDDRLAEFALGYADQNEKDFESFVGAVGSGRLEAIEYAGRTAR